MWFQRNQLIGASERAWPDCSVLKFYLFKNAKCDYQFIIYMSVHARLLIYKGQNINFEIINCFQILLIAAEKNGVEHSLATLHLRCSRLAHAQSARSAEKTKRSPLSPFSSQTDRSRQPFFGALSLGYPTVTVARKRSFSKVTLISLKKSIYYRFLYFLKHCVIYYQ